MHVITLNKIEFKNTCIALGNKISDTGEFTALIGIRKGGAEVAKIIFEHLGQNDVNLQYFEVEATRYTSSIKNTHGIKQLFKRIPRFFLNWLRIAEHFHVKLRMLIFHEIDRSIYIEQGLVNYLVNLNEGRLLLIDDAIDSGATIKSLLNELHSINSGLEYKVAALVVTQSRSIVLADVSLYQQVLLRFPWSSDYKE